MGSEGQPTMGFAHVFCESSTYSCPLKLKPSAFDPAGPAGCNAPIFSFCTQKEVLQPRNTCESLLPVGHGCSRGGAEATFCGRGMRYIGETALSNTNHGVWIQMLPATGRTY